MLYREILAVCPEIYTKQINTLCGQNLGFVNVKPVVHIVTTLTLRVKENTSQKLFLGPCFTRTLQNCWLFWLIFINRTLIKFLSLVTSTHLWTWCVLVPLLRASVCAYVQVADQRISQPDVQWAPVEAHCRLFSLNSQGKKVFKARYVTLTARPTELTSQFVSRDCQATSCPQQYRHAK